MRWTNPTCTIDADTLAKDVTLERRVTIERGCYIGARSIGKCTFIGRNSYVDKGTRSIGRFCSIAMNTLIGLKDHPMDRVSTHPFTYSRKYGYGPDDAAVKAAHDRPTVIGNDVWIGANVTILAGVEVGNGAVIGAHSLVTKDVPPYGVVIGSPARVVRMRFDGATVEALQRSAWWDRDDEWIRAHLPRFKNVGDLLGDPAAKAWPPGAGTLQ